MTIFNKAITGEEAPTDAAAPYSALVNFYRAFNQQDIGLMRENWLQTDEASMSNPLGGVKRGWGEIQSVYERIFNGPATVYVEFYGYSTHTTESMFLAVGRERGYLATGSNKIDLAIRTTRIFVMHDRQWKQLHHHGSMDNPRLLSNYQATVLQK
jgi:hypothetical protein